MTPEVVKVSYEKEGRKLNVKVNCQINGASHEAPEEILVAWLMKKI
jgi:hypothetical protein